ncbi:MAG: hypothetical protein LBF88_03665 [Planctomycetaceae bacterium]|jgi:hypothetical protein|nr:hypothetical protein [Planctomycetaceae bacterium]
MQLKEKITKFILKNRVAIFFVLLVISILSRFAWLFNPILSLWRFRKVRRIGNQIANWCFDSEKNIEIFTKETISHLDWASFELRHPNYVYGYSKALKNYAGLPDIYPIKVSYSHGAILDESIFDTQSKSQIGLHDYKIPVFLAWGHFERDMVKKYHTDNRVYVIGTPFLYADNLFSDEYINNERNRLGKNLLVFPGHSNYGVEQNSNWDKLIASINKYKSDFDSIRICMFWKDIQLGLHKFYTEKGYECVCSGHTEDCNFVSRLKGLLSICDATITNQVGTHVGYSIAMDKPVRVCSPVQISDLISCTSEIPSYFSCSGRLLLNELFIENENLIISNEMRDAVEPYWGLREKKTKEELRQIFFEAEQLFRKSPKRFTLLEYR